MPLPSSPYKMEKVHQTKLCHEELATESRKVDVGASWHRWEEGARLQAQLKEQALSARKTKERQRKTAQVLASTVASCSSSED